LKAAKLQNPPGVEFILPFNFPVFPSEKIGPR
jgi:hypothetical protein